MVTGTDPHRTRRPSPRPAARVAVPVTAAPRDGGDLAATVARLARRAAGAGTFDAGYRAACDDVLEVLAR